jgi:hypothetical protein
VTIRESGARRLAAWTLAALLAVSCTADRPAASPEVTPDQVASLLAAMHPDYGRYIASVRYGATRLRPASLYAGLVRRGGRDPRDPDDGPRSGRGVANDLIVYADTFEPWRSAAWRLLVADHEYFHARHLAHGAEVPVVGFGDAGANQDYYEALAWGYVVGQASAGAYGELTRAERAEAARAYREHRDRFHSFVMAVQPPAWAHYGRFLPDPDVTTPASAPPEAPAPAAAGAGR